MWGATWKLCKQPGLFFFSFGLSCVGFINSVGLWLVAYSGVQLFYRTSLTYNIRKYVLVMQNCGSLHN